MTPVNSKQNHDNSISDYMDGTTNNKSIEAIGINSRDKVYHNFYRSNPIKFDIFSKKENNSNNNLTQISNKNINNNRDWNNKL